MFTLETRAGLRLLPSADLVRGDIRVVRQPVGVFVWDPDLEPVSDPRFSLQPADLPEGGHGRWVPFNTPLELLSDDADTDGDGLTNELERAFLSDPVEPGCPELLTVSTAEDGTRTLNFRCATGPGSPGICLQSSENLTDWTVETSCPTGGLFSQPVAGSVAEVPWRAGRIVTVAPGGEMRKFWRLVLEH